MTKCSLHSIDLRAVPRVPRILSPLLKNRLRSLPDRSFLPWEIAVVALLRTLLSLSMGLLE